MIRQIIFDLDGVLVDAREIHYEALNLALASIHPNFIIRRDEHLSTYDGLPTKKKLAMLTQQKGLPLNLHSEVWRLKQDDTLRIIDRMEVDEEKAAMLKKLKQEGYLISVASNSIRATIVHMLDRRGLAPYVDFIISNEEVKHPKPHSEIYLRCMINGGCNPKECLIVEDSHNGRKAAIESGAHVCAVENPSNVVYDNIMYHVQKANLHNTVKTVRPKWQGGKMKVLIPMAGAGSRFQAAGYSFPKPLIEVHNKPMIQVVVDNLNIDAEYIFIVQREHYDKYNLQYMLNLISPGCKIVLTEGLTEGAACTTLLAEEHINNDEHLLIANSDQFVEWDSNEFLYSMCADEIDGGILTFKATHPKWSFVKLNDAGFVAEVAEKKPISDIANVGIYYWKHGKDYVHYCKQMISRNLRVNNEFYVAPVYNEAIADGKKIKNFNIDRMWGIGDPESLKEFIDGYKGAI